MTNANILATNYRYEINLFPESYFLNTHRLADRVEAERAVDTKILGRKIPIREKICVGLSELSQFQSLKKSNSRIQKIIDKECQVHYKASIIVRRAALRHQLEVDMKLYDKELRAQGKAIRIF